MTDTAQPSADDLRLLIRAAIDEVMSENQAPTSQVADTPSPQAAHRYERPRRVHGGPSREAAIDQIKRSTPAKLATGRTGTRYLTDSYVALRADHAIALDAVNSHLPEDFATEQSWLDVQSRCEDHNEFLLHPNQGRRLSDEGMQLLKSEGDKGSDIQIIAGDGLSAVALELGGAALVQALQQELEAEGFSLGRPIVARYARVGLQDDVGVALGAKATLIIVGERPGLGTGDSLSIYTAYGPEIDQDNSEKDCISNVRPLGFSPEGAASQCRALMRRTFDAGGGGVKIA